MFPLWLSSWQVSYNNWSSLEICGPVSGCVMSQWELFVGGLVVRWRAFWSCLVGSVIGALMISEFPGTSSPPVRFSKGKTFPPTANKVLVWSWLLEYRHHIEKGKKVEVTPQFHTCNIPLNFSIVSIQVVLDPAHPSSRKADYVPLSPNPWSELCC